MIRKKFRTTVWLNLPESGWTLRVIMHDNSTATRLLASHPGIHLWVWNLILSRVDQFLVTVVMCSSACLIIIIILGTYSLSQQCYSWQSLVWEQRLMLTDEKIQNYKILKSEIAGTCLSDEDNPWWMPLSSNLNPVSLPWIFECPFNLFYFTTSMNRENWISRS